MGKCILKHYVKNWILCRNSSLFQFCLSISSLLIIASCSQGLINEGKTFEAPKPIDKGLAYVFDMDALPYISLHVKLDDWNELLVKYDGNNYVKDYIKCNFSFSKEGDFFQINDAGLRLHGNTSRRRPEGITGQKHGEGGKFNHCHYMVNLRKNIKDEEHELQGVRKINFKWFHNDPSYVREIYCYDLFRRYNIWTIADCSYCRIGLQVENESPVYLGVYGMFETVDKQYLKRRKELFGSSSGYLWKCAGVGLNDISDELFGYDDNIVDHPYELKEDTDEFDQAKEQFRGFILKFQTLEGDSFDNWISTVCDVEFLLKTYAVNVACGMWDDYWNNYNNYYFYFNTKDKNNYEFFFIPYDYDESLGRTSVCGVQKDAVTHNPLSWGRPENNLISKIISIPKYREIYVNALHELSDPSLGMLDYSSSVQRISKWHNLIHSYVSNDTCEDMVIEDLPGKYSAQQDYRLWETSGVNYFDVKCASLLSVE